MKAFREKPLPFLIPLLFLALIIGFRSFFMSYIINPIVLGFWMVWRTLSSLDQAIYWTALIIFCVLLFLRLIFYRQDKRPNLAYSYSYRAPNWVDYWRTLIDDALIGEYESEPLRESLSEVVIKIITQVEKPENMSTDEFIKEGTMSLPPAVQEYLFPQSGEHKTFLSQLRNKLFTSRWVWWRKRKYIHEQNALMDEILKWMEAELEINNGK